MKQTPQAIGEERPRASATLHEILSQGRIWNTVLQELRQSAIVKQIIAGNHAEVEWIFVGCGSSFYLAETAAASWTVLTGQRARTVPASEVLLFPRVAQLQGVDAQAVIISRSGKTSEAVRAAEILSGKLRLPTLGMTCGKDTPLEQACLPACS